MTQIAIPFDAGPGSSVAEGGWQKMARHWLATGPISGHLNELAVSAAGTGMTVSVASGGAWIRGFYYETDAPVSLTIGAAHATLARIDRIVARLDRSANTITLAVVAGTAASVPAVPALTLTDDLYELLLADVAVAAAAGVISGGNVTDRRVLTGDARLVLKSQFDAKGDLLVGTTDDGFTRKAVGADDLVLTADSTQATGVAWKAATIVEETWHTVGAGGEPAFASGASTPGGGYQPLQFKKVGNEVRVRGAFSASSGLFTFPSGYRPPLPILVPLVDSFGVSTMVQILTNGVATALAAVNTAGLSFSFWVD